MAEKIVCRVTRVSSRQDLDGHGGTVTSVELEFETPTPAHEARTALHPDYPRGHLTVEYLGQPKHKTGTEYPGAARQFLYVIGLLD